MSGTMSAHEQRPASHTHTYTKHDLQCAVETVDKLRAGQAVRHQPYADRGSLRHPTKHAE